VTRQHYDDDLPNARDVAKGGIKWGLVLMVVVVVLGAVGFAIRAVTAPARMVGGVVDQVFDADNALRNYRWFHEAFQQIKAKTGQIRLAKSALEASAQGRQEARRVELLGVQQGCMGLVSEYNARATRADTVIFQNPERFLPGDWPADEDQLPDYIDLLVCE
jgi:hypothetical protein